MTPPIKPDPPSFYAMLVDALTRHNAGRPASQQYTMGGQPVDPRITSAVRPALLDTLQRLGGTPMWGVRVDESPENAATVGEYGSSDRMALTPLALRVPRTPPSVNPDTAARYARVPTPDYALGHEFGHRLYQQNIAPPALKNDYGDTEGFARAYAAALNAVRATQTMPAQQATEQLGGWAARQDGSTREMVDYVLSNPVFANHPANKQRRLLQAQADATRLPPSHGVAPVGDAADYVPGANDPRPDFQQILAQALLAAQKKRQGVK